MLLAATRARVRARRQRERALDFYRQLVRPGCLCFDVGANRGDRTSLFLALGASVVAVEPQEACADRLRRRFGRSVEVVQAAVGSYEGSAELHVASYDTLSSLSAEWIQAVTESGRFSEFAWRETVSVPMTTLDSLTKRYGRPDFCKVDVEGYELEVLRGLSSAIPALSFEFTMERLQSRLDAIEHLAGLGMTRFNVSLGESMELALPRWVDAGEASRFLEAHASVDSFGDVYARSSGAAAAQHERIAQL